MLFLLVGAIKIQVQFKIWEEVGERKTLSEYIVRKVFSIKKKEKKTTIKETENDALEPVNVTKPGPSLSSVHWPADWACQHIKGELSSSQKKKKSVSGTELSQASCFAT